MEWTGGETGVCGSGKRAEGTVTKIPVQTSDTIFLGWSTPLQMASVYWKVKPYLLNSLLPYPGSLLPAEKTAILVRVYNSGKAQGLSRAKLYGFEEGAILLTFPSS